MESAKEFTTRALQIQSEAISLSRNLCGDNSELNRWMALAKQKGMTWLDGLRFSVEHLRESSQA